MIQIVVDPGLTSGLFVFDTYTKKHEALELSFDELSDYFDNHWAIFEFIVTEKYTISQATLKKTRQYDALHVNGMLRHFAHIEGCTYSEQTPADAKRLATDERLKDQGWWTPGKGHANDAARHMYLKHVREGWIIP